MTMAPNMTMSMEFFREEFRALQPIWDLRHGHEDSLRSPLWPIVTSVTFYLTLMVPFTLLDLFGREWKWLQKFKIQPSKPLDRASLRKALSLTLWNHLVWITPISVAQWIWTPPTQLPRLAPTLLEFFVCQLLALFVFDLEYWIWHTIHHKVRVLYKYVHSVHHQYSATSCWVTQYLHPFELISIGFFTTTSPMIFTNHPLIHWSFMFTSIWISVEDHMGYDFPFQLHNFLPFFGGSVKHDMHHQRPLTNFEPFFNWWDRLAGFECPGQRAGGRIPRALAEWESGHERKKKQLKSRQKLKEKIK